MNVVHRGVEGKNPHLRDRRYAAEPASDANRLLHGRRCVREGVVVSHHPHQKSVGDGGSQRLARRPGFDKVMAAKDHAVAVGEYFCPGHGHSVKPRDDATVATRDICANRLPVRRCA